MVIDGNGFSKFLGVRRMSWLSDKNLGVFDATDLVVICSAINKYFPGVTRFNVFTPYFISSHHPYFSWEIAAKINGITGQPYMRICHVMVEPAARGKGFGTKIVGNLLHHFTRHRFSYYELVAKNDRCARFWHR